MKAEKFYFNRQLMAMCEICGKHRVASVTQDMFEHIQAFQKGAEGWILDKDFIIVAGLAMRPNKDINQSPQSNIPSTQQAKTLKQPE